MHRLSRFALGLTLGPRLAPAPLAMRHPGSTPLRRRALRRQRIKHRVECFESVDWFLRATQKFQPLVFKIFQGVNTGREPAPARIFIYTVTAHTCRINDSSGLAICCRTCRTL